MDKVNLDTLTRPFKTIQLAGREINISKVPLLVNIRAPELYRKVTGYVDMEMDKINVEESDKVILDLLELVMIVIAANQFNEDLTRDWFLRNADSIDLFQFLTTCVNKDIDNVKKKSPALVREESTM